MEKKTAGEYAITLWKEKSCFCGGSPGIRASLCLGCVEHIIRRAMEDTAQRIRQEQPKPNVSTTACDRCGEEIVFVITTKARRLLPVNAGGFVYKDVDQLTGRPFFAPSWHRAHFETCAGRKELDE